MRCWRVGLNECDCVYVLAETPGKATSRAIMVGYDFGAIDDDRDIDWKQVRRKRVPALDGDVLTERQMVEGGYMWTECSGCGGHINGDDHNTIWNAKGAPFCCEQCADDQPQRFAIATPIQEPTHAVFLSTEY